VWLVSSARLTIFIFPQSPNQYLRQWLSTHADSYLSTLFSRDSPPTESCCICQKPSNEQYRCKTCLAPTPRCSDCTLSAHRHSPTHHISKWNGQFWEECSLVDLGLVLHLGHPGGTAISESPCNESQTVHAITVGDLHGFATIHCTFCSHDNSAPRASQLLAAGLMPCTDDVPKSAFTLTMLDHLSVFTTTGKCSGYKYWSVIKRLTKTGFPGEVSNRYRELLQTLRKFNYLMHRKRSGVAFPAHPLEVDPIDQALSCVACPRPRYNFEKAEITKEDEL
jgi:hypothetical protein